MKDRNRPMSSKDAIRMMVAMADMVRDLHLSGAAAEKLLRTNAELIADVECGADDMLERLVRSVQEIVLEKDSGVSTEVNERRRLAVTHMAQDLELVRTIQKLCADAVSGNRYDDDGCPDAGDDIRALDPLELLTRARLGFSAQHPPSHEKEPR